MNDELQAEVTTILAGMRAGEADAAGRLVELVYRQLRLTAEALMRQERGDHTLQPTALVHEALIRLLRPEALAQARDRRDVHALAAQVMRNVLVDHARTRGRDKRGGGRERVPLDVVLERFEAQNVGVLDLHEALERLAALSERQSRVVTLRYFGGMTAAEVAEHLGVSVSTVESDFRLARAWLHDQLS